MSNENSKSLDHLREVALPVARRLIELRDELLRSEHELVELITAQRAAARAAIARGEAAMEAAPGWKAALTNFVEFERGRFTIEEAANRIAEKLGLRESHDDARDLTPTRRLELLLSQRLEAVTKGN